MVQLLFALALRCDVAVIGGGSAGFGAALAAAEDGASVIVVEKAATLGGTSTHGGVNCWEPVCGPTGTPRRVYERLAGIPGAAGVYVFRHHCSWPENGRPCAFPGAWLTIDPRLGYDATLRRHGPGMADERWFREHCHGIVFEPEAMASVLASMLAETGRCRTLLRTAYIGCDAKDGRVASVRLSSGDVVVAAEYVDTTGLLARDAGAMLNMAEHPNGATLVYRVTPRGDGGVETPPDIPSECWWRKRFPFAFCCEYPNGDLNVNMLPTMDGAEVRRLGPEAALAECRRRVFAHWRWMQAQWPEFSTWKLKSIAGEVACRETWRVECEYMLTGEDVRSGRRFPDEIAEADHAIDSHGAAGFGGELRQPYGIPLRSLKPKGLVNVLVAGRIAGFDELAASSCRLSRTMMQLGEAAGHEAKRRIHEAER